MTRVVIDPERSCWGDFSAVTGRVSLSVCLFLTYELYIATSWKHASNTEAEVHFSANQSLSLLQRE